ncbi:MAG: hypothetical protein ACXWLH_04275 [Candidatus Saccharimonadales bacterium]
MFYQKTDPNDPTAKLDVWYTNSDNYAACYSKANEKISFIAGSTCDKMTHGNNVSDSQAWKDCEAAQNSLKNTLNCSGTMFKKLDNRYYTQDDNKVNACKNNVQQAGNVQVVKSDGSLASAPAQGNPAGSATGTGGTTQPKEIGCEFEVTSTLTWVLCPIINDILAPTVDAVDGWITSELNINTSNIFCTDKDTCNAFHSSWESFRNIALGLMVIAGLVIVISQALGMELLDAYTIRKTLPRVLIAAIGITLSWTLAEFAVQLSNDLGVGIRFLIYQPFVHLGNNIDLSFSHTIAGGVGNFFFGTAGLLAAAGATVILFGVILTLLGTAALAVFVAIVVLILRQVAIILLILTAPVAIAAYILPNTQRAYKLWWDSFAKALMMFPIIAGFIAVGRVFSAVTLANSSSLLSQVIGFLAYFAPYFLIPATFRLAGGAIRQLGGFVNDRSKGAFDRLRQRRGREMQQAGQDIRSRQALRRLGGAQDTGLKGRINKGLQATTMLGSAGMRPSMWKENVRQAMADTDAKGLSRDALGHAARALINGNDTLSEALKRNNFDLDKTRQELATHDDIGEAGAGEMVSAYAVQAAKLRREGYTERAIQLATVIGGLSASTAMTSKEDYDPETGEYIGGGNLAAWIQELSGGNANLQAQGIAAVMEATKDRPELMGSFTEGFKAVRDIQNESSKGKEARDAQIKASARTLRRISIYKKGINVLFGSGHTARHEAKEYQVMLQEAYENHMAAQVGGPITVERLGDDGKLITKKVTTADGDQAYTQAQAEAKDKYMQMVAEVVATQNNAGNLALEKRPIVAELIGLQLGPGVSVQSEADGMRMEQQFQKYVSDFGYQQMQRGKTAGGDEAAAENAQRGAAEGAQQGPQEPLF